MIELEYMRFSVKLANISVTDLVIRRVMRGVEHVQFTRWPSEPLSTTGMRML